MSDTRWVLVAVLDSFEEAQRAAEAARLGDWSGKRGVLLITEVDDCATLSINEPKRAHDCAKLQGNTDSWEVTEEVSVTDWAKEGHDDEG